MSLTADLSFWLQWTYFETHKVTKYKVFNKNKIQNSSVNTGLSELDCAQWPSWKCPQCFCLKTYFEDKHVVSSKIKTSKSKVDGIGFGNELLYS